MSHTIAHRPGTRMHLPWVPILALAAVAIVAAAAALIVVDWPASTTTPLTTTVGAATGAGAAAPAVTVPSQAAALTFFKRTYSPDLPFVQAVVLEPGTTVYAKLPAALLDYKRNTTPNVQVGQAPRHWTGYGSLPTAVLTYKRTGGLEQ
jgi:hypothetical protein